MNTSVMPAIHARQVPAVQTDDLLNGTASEFSTHVRHVILTLLILELLFLGSIGSWLWWGMHQYQNIF